MNNKYRKNNNVTYYCRYHIIWCTKYRRKLLTNEIKEDLIQIIKYVCKENNVQIISMEVMEEHVHLLLDVDPQFGVNKIIKLIKGNSSRILRKKYKELTTRVPTLWTNTYFISTLSEVSENVVKEHINNQKVSQRDLDKEG